MSGLRKAKPGIFGMSGKLSQIIRDIDVCRIELSCSGKLSCFLSYHEIKIPEKNMKFDSFYLQKRIQVVLDFRKRIGLPFWSLETGQRSNTRMCFQEESPRKWPFQETSRQTDQCRQRVDKSIWAAQHSEKDEYNFWAILFLYNNCHCFFRNILWVPWLVSNHQSCSFVPWSRSLDIWCILAVHDPVHVEYGWQPGPGR